MFQAQFDYVQNKEWQGTLTRTAINSSGVVDTSDSGNWSAAQKLPTPNNRKIWSVIPGTDYTTDYNNFKDVKIISNGRYTYQVDLTGNSILDYHNTTSNCSSADDVEDGINDDIKGLINFVRGIDYFDYDADCNLTETRKKPMGDIYHSQLVVVGKPSAETSYVSQTKKLIGDLLKVMMFLQRIIRIEKR